jgi:hypothetical protein
VEIRVATFNIGAHFPETCFDCGLGDLELDSTGSDVVTPPGQTVAEDF